MTTRVLIVLQNTATEDVGSVEELILARSQLATIDSGYQECTLKRPSGLSKSWQT